MGFISSLLGTSNDFKAKAPVNSFHATEAALDKSNYANAINSARDAAVNGGGNNTAAGQTALVQALQAQMAGNGPSLAQRQLQSATEQIQQQAAGAVASQRGINPALAARQILDSQNQASQNAAGQSATLRLQEQLATQDRLGQALATQRGQDINQQGANTALLGTVGGLQQGQNALALQNHQGTQALNQNTAAQNAGLNLGAQQINAGVSSQNASTNAGLVGGLINGASSAAMMMAANGGEVVHAAHGYADGPLRDPDEVDGPVDAPTPYQQFSKPVLSNDNAMPFSPAMEPGTAAPSGGSGNAMGKAIGGIGKSLQDAGKAGADAYQRATARAVLGAMLAHGGMAQVPGKASTAGDSTKNDTVPAMLSPGEIVLPRSVAQAEDAPERAKSFVDAIRKQKSKGSVPNYGHTLSKLREIDGRLRNLERMAEGGEVPDAGTPDAAPDAGVAQEPATKPSLLERWFGKKTPPTPPGTNSSPNWKDAASAEKTHKTRLQQALDEAGKD